MSNVCVPAVLCRKTSTGNLQLDKTMSAAAKDIGEILAEMASLLQRLGNEDAVTDIQANANVFFVKAEEYS